MFYHLIISRQIEKQYNIIVNEITEAQKALAIINNLISNSKNYLASKKEEIEKIKTLSNGDCLDKTLIHKILSDIKSNQKLLILLFLENYKKLRLKKIISIML